MLIDQGLQIKKGNRCTKCIEVGRTEQNRTLVYYSLTSTYTKPKSQSNSRLFCKLCSTRARRRPELELNSPIETIVLDVVINNRKWALVGAYRPPSMDNTLFTDLFTKGMDLISTKFDNILILGDLNYDLLDRTKGTTLHDMCDIFDLKNLIKVIEKQ